MARTKKNEYVSKAVTTSIRITSRASVKINDNFYTVEYCEERSLPEDADVEKERAMLWETANMECDNQIADIYNAMQKRKK